jgi:hypothetical protein
VPAQEARLFAPPQEARDSRLRIFSGTANRPLAQVGFSSSSAFHHPEKKERYLFIRFLAAWLARFLLGWTGIIR